MPYWVGVQLAVGVVLFTHVYVVSGDVIFQAYFTIPTLSVDPVASNVYWTSTGQNTSAPGLSSCPFIIGRSSSGCAETDIAAMTRSPSKTSRLATIILLGFVAIPPVALKDPSEDINTYRPPHSEFGFSRIYIDSYENVVKRPSFTNR